MLELMFRAGMRISEVLKLTPNKIDGRKLTFRHPKSGEDKELVYIPQRLSNRFEDYIQTIGLRKKWKNIPYHLRHCTRHCQESRKNSWYSSTTSCSGKICATYASRSRAPIEIVSKKFHIMQICQQYNGIWGKYATLKLCDGLKICTVNQMGGGLEIPTRLLIASIYVLHGKKNSRNLWLWQMQFHLTTFWLIFTPHAFPLSRKTNSTCRQIFLFCGILELLSGKYD